MSLAGTSIADTIDVPHHCFAVGRKEGSSLKNSRTSGLGLRACNLLLAGAAVFLVAHGGSGETNPSNGRPPDLGDCQRLLVEAGNKVAFHVYADGVQIYRWNGTSWIFVAPEAVLFADIGLNGAVGFHYAGPTWESNSGSKVVAMLFDRCTADVDAIDWFLLKAVSSEGPGTFHRVTFIQRVNTTGGLAPSDPGSTVGEIARVPYSAEYFFYRRH